MPRIQEKKKQKDQGQKGRQITGKGLKELILTALVKSPDETEIICNSQSLMVPVIAATCKDRQKQSEETPFMTAPLLDDFGYLGNEEVMYQVMYGTYQPPEGVDQCTLDFLQSLKRLDAVNLFPEINLIVTEDENAKGWQQMKERTASESNTPGFNHYKCGSKDKFINSIDTFLCNSPFETGLSIEMWQRIVDLQILKRSGNYDVTQMRTIQLFVAEFNMANTYAGKMLMARAEQLGEVASEQYGSIKKHKSINTCLNKVLLLDISRYRRKALALAMNNAKGCYDRI